MRFPQPTVIALRNTSSHLPFYNRMVRTARSLPGKANLDSLMPYRVATRMYNPDDFLVYLQLLVQHLGGSLPSRFVPPD